MTWMLDEPKVLEKWVAQKEKTTLYNQKSVNVNIKNQNHTINFFDNKGITE